MRMAHARVSKADGTRSSDLRRNALIAVSVGAARIREGRTGVEGCLRALRDGGALMAWRLDRLGRDLAHLVATVRALEARGVKFRVLAGQGAEIDTLTAGGRLVFGIFAALVGFDSDLIRERGNAGLAAAPTRSRRSGAFCKMTPVKLRLPQAAMGKPETSVSALRRALGSSSQTLCRHLSPTGDLRPDGQRLLGDRTRR